MKRTAILCLILAAAHQQAAERPRWREVASASSARIYADDRRDERDGATVIRWEKIEPRADTREGREARAEIIDALARLAGAERAARFSYSLRRREYRCDEGRSRRLEETDYDERGAVIYMARPAQLGKWETPAPESMAEAAMLDACRLPLELH